MFPTGKILAGKRLQDLINWQISAYKDQKDKPLSRQAKRRKLLKGNKRRLAEAKYSQIRFRRQGKRRPRPL